MLGFRVCLNTRETALRKESTREAHVPHIQPLRLWNLSFSQSKYTVS